MFKKKAGSGPAGASPEPAAESSAEVLGDDFAAGSSELPPVSAPAVDRSLGPFDSEEVEDTTGLIDFGCLLVPPTPGLTVSLEADSASGRILAMSLSQGDSAVQVRVFAAPRSGGLWDRNREALADQVTSGGGRCEESDGPFGPELNTHVPIAAGQPGGPGMRPMRFVGVEGPRWLLQVAFLGGGVKPSTASAIEGVFRGLVVVRGDEAMPVGSLLPLRRPQKDADEGSVGEPAGPGPTLASLEPGQRITEVR